MKVSINRPLKRFGDGVDVGRFIRNGNEECEIGKIPNCCHVDYFVALICGESVLE